MKIYRTKINKAWIYYPDNLKIYTTIFDQTYYGGYGTRMSLFPEIDSECLGYARKRFKHRVSHVRRTHPNTGPNVNNWLPSCRMLRQARVGISPYTYFQNDAEAVIWLLGEPYVQRKFQKAYEKQNSKRKHRCLTEKAKR